MELEEIIVEIENIMGEIMETTRPVEWNYRVVLIDETFCICEVYYDELGDIMLWTKMVGPFGETVKELKKDLKKMRQAFEWPVLKQVGEDEFAKLILWEGK